MNCGCGCGCVEGDVAARAGLRNGRHRLRILDLLDDADGPVCVCRFTDVLGIPQQNVSYHVKQLLDARVIERERRGRYSYYALVEGALDQIASLAA